MTNVYTKDVSKLSTIDVYRVLDLYKVTHPAIQHAIKKLLCAGERGVKDQLQDIEEAMQALQRWKDMEWEDDVAAQPEQVRVLIEGHPPSEAISTWRAGQLWQYLSCPTAEWRTCHSPPSQWNTTYLYRRHPNDKDPS